MGAIMITRLTLSDGSGVVAYDILRSNMPVFLEKTYEKDIYKIVLREGQYEFLIKASRLSICDVQLATGLAIRGEIVGAISDHAPRGAAGPDLLVLKLKTMQPLEP